MQNCIIYQMINKTKGQQSLAAKRELLAFCYFRGGLAERSNAFGCKPIGGAYPIAQGFESLTRRQDNYTPAEALTSTGARAAQPKPYGSVNLSIRLLAVTRKENHSDVPQLPDRVQKIRETPGRDAALPLFPMR